MSTDLSHFKDAFFEESQEHLTTIEEGLLQLEQRPGDLDLLNRIFRGAHSIKGNSGMFGFTAVSQFTHKMESVLDQLRSGQMVVTVELTDLLLRSLDCLKNLIECARTGQEPDQPTIVELGGLLESSQGIQQGAPRRRYHRLIVPRILPERHGIESRGPRPHTSSNAALIPCSSSRRQATWGGLRL